MQLVPFSAIHIAYPLFLAAVFGLITTQTERHPPSAPHIPAVLEPKHAQQLAEKALVAAVIRPRAAASKELILRGESPRVGRELVATDSVIVGKLYKYQLVERISPPVDELTERAALGQSDARNPLLLGASPGRHYLTPWEGGGDDGCFGGKYRLRKRFAKGSHGEVWHANGVSVEGSDARAGGRLHVEAFVLKRLFVEQGEQLRRSGEREKHFGELLRGKRGIVRFVEAFNRSTVVREEQERVVVELWLVFRYEGKSLDALLYNPISAQGSVIWESSSFWRAMRTSKGGPFIIREILYQLLQALALLSENSVTHRDLKPANVLVSEMNASPQLKLCDFGSAVDTKSPIVNQVLYGPEAINQKQETADYAPPEAFINPDKRFPYFSAESCPHEDCQSVLHAFDIWSTGILALELLLADSKVFAVSARTRRLVDTALERKFGPKTLSQQMRDQSYYIASLEKFGISQSGMNATLFNLSVTAQDPYKKGFHIYNNKVVGDAFLHLVFAMLQWHPHRRATAEELLKHEFFEWVTDKTAFEARIWGNSSFHRIHRDGSLPHVFHTAWLKKQGKVIEGRASCQCTHVQLFGGHFCAGTIESVQSRFRLT